MDDKLQRHAGGRHAGVDAAHSCGVALVRRSGRTLPRAGAFFIPTLLKERVPRRSIADALDEMLRRGLPDLQTRTVASRRTIRCRGNCRPRWAR